MNTLEDNIEKKEDRKKRLNIYLQDFLREWNLEHHENPIKYELAISETCENIVEYYWKFITLLKEAEYIISENNDNKYTNINTYKIISGTELSIIKHQPISGGGNESYKRTINAFLAIYVSFRFYREWFKKDLNGVSFDNGELQRLWEKFLGDRLTWLINFDESDSFPFFLNSQIWSLMDIHTRHKIE